MSSLKPTYNQLKNRISVLEEELNSCKQANATYRNTVLNAVSDAIAIVDTNSICTYANGAYCQFLQIDNEDVTNQPLHTHWPVGFFETSIRPVLNRCTRHAEMQTETHVVSLKNKQKYFKIRYTPYFTANLQFSGIILSITDNSHFKTMGTAKQNCATPVAESGEKIARDNWELKRQKEEYEALYEEFLAANEELKQQNEEYQTLNKNYVNANNELEENKELLKDKNAELEQIFSALPLALLYTDHKNKITKINPAFERIFGYTANEILGKSADIFYAEQPNIQKEHLPANNSINAGPNAFELQYRRKDGKPFFGQTIRVDVKNYSEKTVGALVLINDITAQKEAEAAHRIMQNRYQTMAENFPQGAIFLFDSDIRYKLVAGNALKVVGLRPEVAENNTVYELFPESLWRTAGPFCKKIFDDEQVYYEVTYKNRHYANWGVPVKNEAGEINEGLVYVLDITALKNKEIALKQSEEHYRLLAETANDLILLHDMNGKIIYVNNATLEATGYSREEITKTGVQGLVSESSKKQIQENKLLRESGNFNKHNFLLEILTRHGELIPLEASSSPVLTAGKVTAILVIARDITERQKFEKDLHFQAKLLKNISDLITATDLEGNIIYVNDAEERLLGRKKEELIGSNVSTYGDKADEGATQREIIQQTLTNKKWRGEVVNYNAKGEKVILDTRTELITNEKNEPQYMVGISTDITERKRAEIDLRKSEYQLRRAEEVAKAGSFFWEYQTGEIVWSENLYKLFERNPEAGVPGMEWHKTILSSDDWKRFQDTVNQAIKNKSGYTFSAKVQVGNRKKHLKTSAEIELGADNQIVNFLGVTQDITHQKQIEKELIQAKEKAEESDRLKTAFLNNISHEFRTPMNGILGFVDLIASSQTNAKQHYVQYINESCEQLLDIVTDTIEVSQVQSNLVEVRENELNIKKVMRDILNCVQPKLRDKPDVEVIFNIEIPDINARFISDERKLHRIIKHLIDNAIKFTIKGKIVIHCTIRNNNELFFSVEDTGIGISPEMQRIIFRPFRQVEMGNARNYGGNGIGLSLVKAYIEMLNGKIGLKSKMGIGTTFFFTIPYKIVRKDDERASVETMPLNNWEGKIILIAEDEIINYLFLSELLGESNAHILHAKHGGEAIDTCRNNRDIDLILMDIKMPFVDGYQAAYVIKQFRSEIPIIAQTAYALEKDKEKIFRSGFDDYIEKPIRRELLIKKLSNYL